MGLNKTRGRKTKAGFVTLRRRWGQEHRVLLETMLLLVRLIETLLLLVRLIEGLATGPTDRGPRRLLNRRLREEANAPKYHVAGSPFDCFDSGLSTARDRLALCVMKDTELEKL